MSNIEKLETAIRTALPELMELDYDGVIIVDMRNPTPVMEYKYAVTILHLLRWLDRITEPRYSFSLWTNGALVTIDNDAIPDFHIDLSKPLLRNQSEEVINELVKLVI